MITIRTTARPLCGVRAVCTLTQSTGGGSSGHWTLHSRLCSGLSAVSCLVTLHTVCSSLPLQALYCTVLYSTVLYYVQYYAVLYSAKLYFALYYSTVLYSAVQFCGVCCCRVQCVLQCAVCAAVCNVCCSVQCVLQCAVCAAVCSPQCVARTPCVLNY